MNNTEILIKAKEYLINTKKVHNQTHLGDVLGITKGNFSQMIAGKRNFPEAKANYMFSLYPELKSILGIYENKSNVTQVIVEDDNIMRVPVVPIYAQAGFLPGVSDPVYIDTLPTMEVIVDKQYKGKYFIFEVHGDSMDDGSRDSLLEGDMVLCRSVHPDYWRSKLHYRQWKYWVIATKEEGIVIKQIVDHDVEGGIITVHSLNDYYKDYMIDLRDVQCLLNVTRIVERRI